MTRSANAHPVSGDLLRVAVAACLARYKGLFRYHTESDLRVFCVGAPTAASIRSPCGASVSFPGGALVRRVAAIGTMAAEGNLDNVQPIGCRFAS
jgi:hypothetical protein